MKICFSLGFATIADLSSTDANSLSLGPSLCLGKILSQEEEPGGLTPGPERTSHGLVAATWEPLST